MILELCRIWTDWLAHPTYGINARLGDVERDTGDDVPPAIVTFAEPTSHGGAARLQLAADRFPFPGLLVTPYTEALLGDGVQTELFPVQDFPLAFLYVQGDDDVARAMQDGSYTIRAVLRAMNALVHPQHVASRTRNTIVIEEMSRVLLPRPIAPLEGTTMTLALFASFQVRIPEIP
jgi:hypothetical protein